MTDVGATLKERGGRYGDFSELSRVSQGMKNIMRSSTNWDKLPDDMKESLDMNIHKISRILTGDFDYVDNWHDISGYCTLVENKLNNK